MDSKIQTFSHSKRPQSGRFEWEKFHWFRIFDAKWCKVGDCLAWDNETFYIADINKDYYIIRFTSFRIKNAKLLSEYRYGPVIDDGYKTKNCYRNVNPGIKLK